MDNILQPPQPQHTGSHNLFLVVVGLVFFALAAVFVFFPRTTYSELEKRDLASAPGIENLMDNPSKFTSDVSFWFSDSEPYRDHFMTMSMGIRNGLKYHPFGSDEEVVSFRPSDEEMEKKDIFNPGTLEAQGNPLAEENAKIATKGIFVVGKEPTARAMSAFGGTPQAEKHYLETLHAYAEELPGVQVYAMPIPNATEFYLPTKAASNSKPQKPVLDYIRDNEDKRVKFVDVYPYLSAHTRENIYHRTDHHWAPLGAYYATQALAVAAGVPFRTLESYDKKVVHGFVGSMYGYSKDIAVKNSPEDFVYYVPKDVNYETTYISYKRDKDFNIVSESAPRKGEFFKSYPDGSGGAYSTYMGGDSHLVKITTGTQTPRKLLIVKDSHGNPISSFLFYSFSEIHVVDFRYFTKNMKQYVEDNGITDVVLAFGIFNTCNTKTMEKAKDLLYRAPGLSNVKDKKEEKKD